jgi:hypothetical protein
MRHLSLALDTGAKAELLWSYPAGGSSPAVAGGMVFDLGSGKVYAFGRGGDAP